MSVAFSSVKVFLTGHSLVFGDIFPPPDPPAVPWCGRPDSCHGLIRRSPRQLAGGGPYGGAH